MDKRVEKTIENLKRNNINACFVNTKEDALKTVKQMLNAGETIGCGGSMTLKEIGVRDLAANGDYNYIDTASPDISAEEKFKRFRECFFADTYLSSANAITENGEIYNVDGNSNRVAALMFGPERVIIVVGINKLVKDFDEAVKRTKETAAPKNTVRLNCDTYCYYKGHCAKKEIGAGCFSEKRICCSYTLLSYQRIKNRINVIICDENLGY